MLIENHVFKKRFMGNKQKQKQKIFLDVTGYFKKD